ncbi:MAG: hypothetical protein RBR93_08140 [Aliarcobacter butzleri]|nr:hypothetical protein [Aliarcobacter butzleri]
MGKLIPIDDISKELEAVPFLDAPEGYWNKGGIEGYNGFEQISISDMDENHIKNSIKMIKEKYVPHYSEGDYILELLEKKIEELEEEL